MIGIDRLAELTTDLAEDEVALVSTASSLVPALRANADTADAVRTLPDETVTAMRKAGLFRLATPRAYGGAQAGSRAVTAIAAEVGRGCSSAAWVLTVFYSGGLATWLFPEAVRRRVWETDPDATVCGSSSGRAPVRQVDGGYLLSGRWGWASGVHHATWIVLDIVGENSTDRGLALVPTRDLTIEDTWHMAGMRGTGSNTVVADKFHVPQEQVLFLSRTAASVPGVTLPRPQGLDSTLAGPLLGMGMAVYDHVVAKLSEGRRLASGIRAIDVPGIQTGVADAAMLIDSAIMQAARSAQAVDRAMRTGERLTPFEEVRVRVDAGIAARQVRKAVDKLLDVGGAGCFAESCPAQRIWRDLGTAIRHPVYVLEVSRERIARLLLDVD